MIKKLQFTATVLSASIASVATMAKFAVAETVEEFVGEISNEFSNEIVPQNFQETVHLQDDMHLAETSGGLPQLDPSTFSSQVFWLFIAFALLYLVVSRIALPRVSSVVEERETKISRDIENATELKRQADEVKTAYEASLATARDKSQSILRDVQDGIAKKATAEHSDLTARIQAQMSEHEEQIVAAKNKALASIEEASAVIAIEAANKIAQIAVNDNEANEAVQQQIKKEVG